MLDGTLIDRVIAVGDDEAMEMAHRLASEEGILCGISAGANVLGALAYASEPRNAGKLVVTVIPDFGERYLQTALFERYRYEGRDTLGA